MKRLFSAVLLLFASVCAWGQGATVLFPALEGPNGTNIPFAKITFCTSPATFDSLGNCTNTVTVFKDIALTQPYSSAILTDGLGNFPPNPVTTTGLWFPPAQNYCYTATGSNILNTVSACKPFSVSVATGSSPTFASVTVTGALTAGTLLGTGANSQINAKNLNGILFASQWCSGSTDLGVCINNAVASSATPQWIVVDTASPSTISTSPALPFRWKISFSPATYTLATTWAIQHQGTIFDFGGSRLNYNQDSGAQAFLIGKNIVGTVNTTNSAVSTCPSNCVTSVSGTNFAAVDAQVDEIVINNVPFNVCSVFSNTLLRVCSAPGTQNGVNFSVLFGNTALTNSAMVIRDLEVNYSGAATANDICVEADFANTFILANVQCGAFSSGTALKFLGVLDASVYNFRSISNKTAGVMDAYALGGVASTPSNNNLFSGGNINGSTNNPAFLLQNGCTSNTFQKMDVESNTGTLTFSLLGAGLSNVFRDNFFQGNGDGTGSGADISISGTNTGTIIDGNSFNATGANHPAIGVTLGASTVNTAVRSNTWVGPYTTAWTYTAGATGGTYNNSVATGAILEPSQGPALANSGVSEGTGRILANTFGSISGNPSILGNVFFGNSQQSVISSAGVFEPVNMQAIGTAAGLSGTGACGTITTQLGGAWVGTFKCTGATAASTVTITPGITATNGWTCYVQDETTRANLFQQTSHSQTTCVLTATSITQNDVFVFSAIAF